MAKKKRIVSYDVEDDFQNYIDLSITIWNWCICLGWDDEGPYAMGFNVTEEPK